jgi:hypothetical protein
MISAELGCAMQSGHGFGLAGHSSAEFHRQFTLNHYDLPGDQRRMLTAVEGSVLRAARAATIGLTLIGVIVFGGLLVIVLSNGRDFEARAQAFIVHEIERQYDVSLEAVPLERLKGLLTKEVEATRRAITDFIVAAVGAMCRLDCTQRAELEAAMEKIYQRHLAALNVGLEKLRATVERRYHETLDELRGDILIFLSVNLVAVGIALLLALFRGAAARHLLPIAGLLTVSTIIAACWYVFGRNWLWAIIYSDYVGWAYLGILGVLFIFLADIALNRARVTSEALNVASNLLGSGGSWSPC